MQEFDLPPMIKELFFARNALRAHYQQRFQKSDGDPVLKFVFDGNFVGDLGEAVAAELFGIKLVEEKSVEAIDGFAPDGVTSVQIKATGTGRGPAFRATKTRAMHLLFFDFDFSAGRGRVIFNGPEHYARLRLPKTFDGQRSLTRNAIVEADEKVKHHERLRPIELRELAKVGSFQR